MARGGELALQVDEQRVLSGGKEGITQQVPWVKTRVELLGLLDEHQSLPPGVPPAHL